DASRSLSLGKHTIHFLCPERFRLRVVRFTVSPDFDAHRPPWHARRYGSGLNSVTGLNRDSFVWNGGSGYNFRRCVGRRSQPAGFREDLRHRPPADSFLIGMKHIGVTGDRIGDEHDRHWPGSSGPGADPVQSLFPPRAALAIASHFARMAVLDRVAVRKMLDGFVHHRALVRRIEDRLATMMKHLRFFERLKKHDILRRRRRFRWRRWRRLSKNSDGRQNRPG